MNSAKSLIIVVAVLFSLVSPTFAQTAMRVTVPFNFTVGKQSLSAGDYRVTVKYFPPALMVDRIDGPGSASVLPSYANPTANRGGFSKLVFHCYASHCFLYEAWMREVGYQLSASSAELEYAQKAPQDRMIVAARTDTK
jgi:hypothetical protein